LCDSLDDFRARRLTIGSGSLPPGVAEALTRYSLGAVLAQKALSGELLLDSETEVVVAVPVVLALVWLRLACELVAVALLIAVGV
jgi:hypothetical protein